MTLTVKRCTEYIDHTLHTEGGGAGPDPLTVLNLTGVHFFSMHGWAFNERTEVELPLTQGQGYVDLPASVGDIIELAPQDSNIQALNKADIKAIQQRRNSTTPGTTYDRLWTLMRADPTATTTKPQGAPLKRIEFWPEAGAGEKFLLTYRREWVDVQEDQEELPIPRYAELLFFEVLKAVARGLEHEDVAGVSERVTAIRQLDVFQAAVRADANQEPLIGPWTGGYASRPRYNDYRYGATMDDPS